MTEVNDGVNCDCPANSSNEEKNTLSMVTSGIPVIGVTFADVFDLVVRFQDVMDSLYPGLVSIADFVSGLARIYFEGASRGGIIIFS